MTGEPAPAPVLDTIAAIVDNLDDLLATTGTEAADQQLREGFHRSALDDLRAIATASGVDWDEVVGERDRRSVVAE